MPKSITSIFWHLGFLIKFWKNFLNINNFWENLVAPKNLSFWPFGLCMFAHDQVKFVISCNVYFGKVSAHCEYILCGTYIVHSLGHSLLIERETPAYALHGTHTQIHIVQPQGTCNKLSIEFMEAMLLYYLCGSGCVLCTNHMRNMYCRQDIVGILGYRGKRLI